MTVYTPLEALPQLSRQFGIDLWVKRDDLYPFTGGGNKARKIMRIVSRLERDGYDSLVTTGGLQSNLARAAALAAAARQWPCVLVLHDDHEASLPLGNYLLMTLAGARVEVVPPERIGAAMEKAVERLRAEGRTPYKLPGGGHTLEGALAYVEAAKELVSQCQEIGWWPDWVILASGTGTTQAGLIIGLASEGMRSRVVGISVAREKSRGTKAVEEACLLLQSHLGLHRLDYTVEFYDEWIDGGYSRASTATIDVIHRVARAEGLILDPTYTGKAFRGLLELVNSGVIEKGARVLFWHTGGLLNLVSSCYFYKSVSRGV